jgi:hypothetical protein
LSESWPQNKSDFDVQLTLRLFVCYCNNKL